MTNKMQSRWQAMLLGGVAAVALMSAGAAGAQEQTLRFDIPQQEGAQALNQFAAQAGVQIVFPYAAVKGRQAPAIQGDYTRDEALRQLTLALGLQVTADRGGVISLRDPLAQGEGGSSAAAGNDVEALIVTAQKKEEAIQDVPIAISAFTQKSLDAQKIEGGFDLLKAIPNVTFSKNNFNGYNFSIRGIGTKAVSATTDPGVAVSFNNTTLIVNRLFEQEYYDVERVEVLRGPQGTLYGRNATSGVINVLSARPRLGEFEGDIKLEGGNYNAQRVRGMINVPVGDKIAIRLAGALTKRDGYGVNEAADDPDAQQQVERDVDDRDLWSARLTVGWEPIEAIRVNALWERFQEDDRRVRTSKQLCHRDDGFDSPLWDEVAATVPFGADNPALIMGKAITSQGCQAGSLYEDGAFGTPNGASLPYVGGHFWAGYYGAAYFNMFGLGPNPYNADNFYYQLTGATPPTPPCPAAAAVSNTSPLSLCQPDPYAGLMQSRDIRTIYSLIEPKYRAKADIFELSLDIDLTDELTFTSQTVFNRDEYYATQDYNRFTTFPIFNDSTDVCGEVDLSMFGLGTQIGPCPAGEWDLSALLGAPDGTFVFDGSVYAPTPARPNGFYNVTPGGIFTDPQLGPSSTLVGQDLSEATSEQFNQEFRLVSNYDAPVNFSLGANFTHFETMNDYYVFLNSASLLANLWPFNTHRPTGINGCGRLTGDLTPEERVEAAGNCVYIDPNPLESINGEGHNYFRSSNPYKLTSSALFGELYWQATDTLKVTLGARMTWDRKVFTPVPSQLLLWDYRPLVPPGAGPAACDDAETCRLAGTGVGGRGSPALPDIVQQWSEPTGRIIVDWKPDLGFTDETMIYASYAHGYKGGGANPPNIAPPAGIFNAKNSGGVNPPTFEPEFIDAFELGTKNILMDGALILNASAFYYAYEEYQVSKIVDRSAYNENFDARIWGLESEWIFSPTRNLRFNGTIGYLNTEIGEGERSIDLMNRAFEGTTQTSWIDGAGVEHELGYTEWLVLKPWIASTSNCVVPKELVEELIVGEDGQTRVFDLLMLCPGGQALGGTFINQLLPSGRFYNPALEAPNGGAGFFTELGGNELPNAPHWTASLGAQYRFTLPGGWDGTIRGDFYWQDQSFARVYNTEYDRLEAWTNTNISLWVENPDWGVTAEVYVKNVFDEEPITDSFLNSDDSGLTTNVFTLDPRLIGVSVRKQF